jgi:hypothetical protein
VPPDGQSRIGPPEGSTRGHLLAVAVRNLLPGGDHCAELIAEHLVIGVEK